VSTPDRWATVSAQGRRSVTARSRSAGPGWVGGCSTTGLRTTPASSPWWSSVTRRS